MINFIISKHVYDVSLDVKECVISVYLFLYLFDKQFKQASRQRPVQATNRPFQATSPESTDRLSVRSASDRTSDRASQSASSRGGVKGHDRIGRHVTGLIGSRRRETTPGLQAEIVKVQRVPVVRDHLPARSRGAADDTRCHWATAATVLRTTPREVFHMQL